MSRGPRIHRYRVFPTVGRLESFSEEADERGSAGKPFYTGLARTAIIQERDAMHW